MTTARLLALALSALMTVGTVAGMNGLASRQYVAAERLAQVAADATRTAAPRRVPAVTHRVA